MTIPPASEREVRPCSKCIFQGYDLDENGDPELICIISGYHFSKRCVYNFNAEELKTLIDLYNQLESIPLSLEVAARIRAVIDKHKQEQQP